MYGTPVITHGDFGFQGPEVEAISDGVNGRFFKRDDSHDLALKIREWLIDHPSTDEALRKSCYKIVDERYNPYYQIEVLRKHVGAD
jgi:glycosyltransferase involved in cell wall biosynthesis